MMFDALWGWPPPVLDPAGPYADKVTVLAWVLLALGVVVTAIVCAALWVAIRGPAPLKQRLGGESAIWIGGIAFPGVVLTALLIWGLTLTANLTDDVVEVIDQVVGELVELVSRVGHPVEHCLFQLAENGLDRRH